MCACRGALPAQSPALGAWRNRAPLLVLGSHAWNSPNKAGRLACGPERQARILQGAASGCVRRLGVTISWRAGVALVCGGCQQAACSASVMEEVCEGGLSPVACLEPFDCNLQQLRQIASYSVTAVP